MNDTMDQMLRRYTSQRRSSRWPMAKFFNILDIAALAAYLIYYENNKMIKKKTAERRLFLRKLSEELAKPMIEERMTNPQVTRDYTTKISIESITGREITRVTQDPGPSVATDKTGRKKITGSCYLCYKMTIKRRRKTRKSCSECERPVCDEHTAHVVKCIECNK